MEKAPDDRSVLVPADHTEDDSGSLNKLLDYLELPAHERRKRKMELPPMPDDDEEPYRSTPVEQSAVSEAEAEQSAAPEAEQSPEPEVAIAEEAQAVESPAEPDAVVEEAAESKPEPVADPSTEPEVLEAAAPIDPETPTDAEMLTEREPEPEFEQQPEPQFEESELVDPELRSSFLDERPVDFNRLLKELQKPHRPEPRPFYDRELAAPPDPPPIVTAPITDEMQREVDPGRVSPAVEASIRASHQTSVEVTDNPDQPPASEPAVALPAQSLQLGIDAGVIPSEPASAYQQGFEAGRRAAQSAPGAAGPCWRCGQSAARPEPSEQVRELQGMHEAMSNSLYQWPHEEFQALREILEAHPASYLDALISRRPMYATVRVVLGDRSIKEFSRDDLRMRITQ